jgi:predicted CoA-binding protein
MDELDEVLRSARTIELVDWPHQDVPATLIRAGFDVFGHEPDGLRRYLVVDARPEVERSFPLDDGGWLTHELVDALPAEVDIVNTSRPPEEQTEIARDAATAGARVFWVQDGVASSDEARQVALDAGMRFVDGACITAAARRSAV